MGKSGYIIMKDKCKQLQDQLQQAQADYAELLKIHKDNLRGQVEDNKRAVRLLERGKEIVERQREEIDKLKLQLSESETARLAEQNRHEIIVDELCRYMGFVRRWWYNFNHKVL